MNLLARILSHGFAITIVALLVIGFMYRGELFPEWELPDFLTLDSETVAQVEDASGTVERTASDVRVPADVQDQPPPAPGMAMPEVEVPVTGAEEAAADVARGAIGEAETVEAGVAQDSDMPGSAASETIVDERPEMESRDDEATAGEAAVELPEVRAPGGEEASPMPATSSQDTHYQLLANAREAFWLRNYEEAEDIYRELTRLEPENSDSYGELANMYYTEGRWEEAAAAYYEAGVRLVRAGRLEQASQLVKVIRSLDGAQADELEDQVSAAR